MPAWARSRSGRPGLRETRGDPTLRDRRREDAPGVDGGIRGDGARKKGSHFSMATLSQAADERFVPAIGNLNPPPAKRRLVPWRPFQNHRRSVTVSPGALPASNRSNGRTRRIPRQVPAASMRYSREVTRLTRERRKPRGEPVRHRGKSFSFIDRSFSPARPPGPTCLSPAWRRPNSRRAGWWASSAPIPEAAPSRTGPFPRSNGACRGGRRS